MFPAMLRKRVFSISFFAVVFLSAGVAYAQQPAADSSENPAKPKKLFTNDDVAPASTTAAPAAKPAAPAHQPKEGDPQLANQLRGKLDKLNAQLADADKKIDELKRFQAGELSGDAGRQLHKGYSTEPIPDEIAKLEEKKKQIQDQVEAIYDQARKKGILPGQLR
ncbi:MAG TPA: hypothetical protein VGF20_07260 [Candidatus Acidoferrum sp.]